MSERLSAYFSLSELVRSQLAARHGIDNRPHDAEIITRARALARQVLDPIREQFGPFSPTSWYRCEPLEWLLCWRQFERWARPDKTWRDYVARKQHPKGEAADIVLPDTPAAALYQWIAAHLDFDQLILEGRPGNEWVHVSYRQNDNRTECFERSTP